MREKVRNKQDQKCTSEKNTLLQIGSLLITHVVSTNRKPSVNFAHLFNRRLTVFKRRVNQTKINSSPTDSLICWLTGRLTAVKPQSEK